MRKISLISLGIICSYLSACASLPDRDECNSLYQNQKFTSYVKQCASLHDAQTDYQLYTIYRDGNSGSVNLPVASYYLQQAAQKGYVPASYSICQAYVTGELDFPVNSDRAIYWCNTAIGHGYNDANRWLGTYYYNYSQYKTAIKYLRKVTKEADPQAMYLLANSYLILHNKVQGFTWMKVAYQQNSPQAQQFVAQLDGKYGKCNIEDVYFKSSLSYSEAMQTCADLNAGKINTETVIMRVKKAVRSIF
ncbi:MAG: hypothetical protein RLZZ293_1378 [Pseudomonadota bacterium]